MVVYPNQVFHLDVDRNFVFVRSEIDYISGSIQAERFKLPRYQRASNLVMARKISEDEWEWVIYIHKDDGIIGKAKTPGKAIGMADVELYKWEERLLTDTKCKPK